MIHRSPTTSCSCISIHPWRGVAISPGCQKILSTSITGSPVISPNCLARVDLPDAPRPTMTTRSMLFILRRLGFDAKVPGSSIVQLTGKCPTNAFTVQVDFGQFDFSDYATNQDLGGWCVAMASRLTSVGSPTRG